MDRCTIRIKTGEARCSQLDGSVVIDRLAAYEDTGFEPSEISEREEMFVAYRHICGGKSPEEVRAALDELSAYRELGTVEELTAIKAFAERAKRDYTECDKMFIHISELDKALKETTHENN